MKRFPLWHIALIVAICIAAYANSLSGALLWDDELQIAKNPTIRDLSSIPEAFTTPFWSFISPDTAIQNNFYRPLHRVAYTLTYAVGGLSPTPYHVLNLAFHTLASVSVYLILAELGFSASYLLLGAALFAVHPIHTEAVSWIAATPEVTCGFFYFVAFWMFLKSDSGNRRVWLIGSAVAFWLALLCKEMAITLPALVLLATFRPGARAMRISERLTLMVPYAGAAAAYLAMRVNALGFVATTHNPYEASLLDWVSLGIYALGQYIRYTLLPYPLVAFHLVPVRLADRVVPTLLALALITGVAFATWRWFRGFREAALWSFAFVLLLIPVFYFKGISTALISERYLYIPSLAAIALLISSVARSPRKEYLWAGWILAGVFTVTTIARNQTWTRAETLYASTLEREPEVANFRINLADILLKRNDDAGAAQNLVLALQSLASPKYVQNADDLYRAHVGLGAILVRAQKYVEARQHLEEAKRIRPTGEWPHLYLGAISMQKDADDLTAIDHFQTAIRLAPFNEVARDYLGVALFNLGRIPEAQAAFEEALRINPSYQIAREHLALSQKSARPQ